MSETPIASASLVCAAQDEITIEVAPGRISILQTGADGSREDQIDLNSKAAVRALIRVLSQTLPRSSDAMWPVGGAE